MKHWKILLGVLIGCVALYFTLRNVNLDLIWQALANADLRYLLPSLVCFAATLLLRAWRWSRLMGGTPFWVTLHANHIGYMLNMTLPLRVGEIGRSYAISARSGVSLATAIGAVLVERLLDLASIVILFMICAQQVPVIAQLGGAAVIAGLVVVGCVFGFAAILWQAPMLERLIERVAPLLRMAPGVLGGRFRALSASLDVIRAPKTLLACTVLSIGVWITGIGVIYFTMLMFWPATLAHASIATVMSNLGGALPGLPGGIGPAQLAARQSLVGPFGIDENLAVAFVLFNQFFQQALLIVLGLVGLARLGLNFGEVRRA